MMSSVKTASELALEYWDKPPIERINNTIQDYVYGYQQKRIDELENRINGALEAMDAESANSWGIWKEKACMYEQGASSAYEKSYWILKGEQDD